MHSTLPLLTIARALGLVTLLVAPLSAVAATIISTFDSDAEGWIANPGEGALTHAATGGNPGGHIRIQDIGAGSVPFGSGAFAPGNFLGNLSSFDGGTLSLDMATFAGSGPSFPSFGAIQLSGGGDIAMFDIAVSAPGFGTWETYMAPLTASSWGKSQSEWLAILADVTSIGIPTDAFDGNDTIGIDNFAIANSMNNIPQPASLALLGIGIASLCLLRKGFGIRPRSKADPA